MQGLGTKDWQLGLVQQCNNELREQILLLERRMLQQQQQSQHEVKTWKLAAQQAASVAEAAKLQVEQLEGNLRQQESIGVLNAAAVLVTSCHHRQCLTAQMHTQATSWCY